MTQNRTETSDRPRNNAAAERWRERTAHQAARTAATLATPPPRRLHTNNATCTTFIKTATYAHKQPKEIATQAVSIMKPQYVRKAKRVHRAHPSRPTRPC